jgi:hypothetical protein
MSLAWLLGSQPRLHVSGLQPDGCTSVASDPVARRRQRVAAGVDIRGALHAAGWAVHLTWLTALANMWLMLLAIEEMP